MELNVIKQRVLLLNRRLTVLFAVIFICIFLLPPCVGSSSDPNGSVSIGTNESAADSNNPVEDINGPTILLGYNREEFKENPISSFMYFIPLIAPTPVDNISSASNKQHARIISYKKNVTSKSFKVVCEFEILGKGFHMNTFDSAAMIETHTDELKNGETMTHMLDYIKFEGDCFGIIEVEGTMKDSNPTVTGVSMQFNAKDSKSPVTAGLYDVKPKDGVYKYENRSNEIVARVNTLSFKKTDKTPHMGIKVATIAKKNKTESFFSGVKGFIANLFIKPPKVDNLGNTTMLEFGHAILQKDAAFTFPKAKNIRENRIVKMCPK